MQGTTLRRLLLVSMLVGSVGLATQATAFAGTSAHRHVAVSAKKRKKKPTVKVADSSLGQILVNSKGFTLYEFEPNGTDTSTSKCSGACAAAWPKLESKKPKAGKGVDATLLTVGGDGQVAYNGHLLHQYAGDAAAGDTNGQGFGGGIWYVVGADGEPIH